MPELRDGRGERLVVARGDLAPGRHRDALLPPRTGARRAGPGSPAAAAMPGRTGTPAASMARDQRGVDVLQLVGHDRAAGGHPDGRVHVAVASRPRRGRRSPPTGSPGRGPGPGCHSPWRARRTRASGPAGRRPGCRWSRAGRISDTLSALVASCGRRSGRRHPPWRACHRGRSVSGPKNVRVLNFALPSFAPVRSMRQNEAPSSRVPAKSTSREVASLGAIRC